MPAMTEAVLLAVWLAQGQPDLTAPFLQLGAIGGLALLLLWFALTAYKDVRKQRDDCQAQAEQLQKDMVALLNTVLPLVTQANTVMSEAMIEVRRMREVR